MLNQNQMYTHCANGLLITFSLGLGRVNCTFRKVAEACWGRDGGQVVLSHPHQVLALALRVETLLLRVPGRQEGAGVEALPRELDYLLRLDPAAVHELEALQVDDLRVRARHTCGWYATRICVEVTPARPQRRNLAPPTRMGGSLQRSSFLVASRCVLHFEQ